MIGKLKSFIKSEWARAQAEQAQTTEKKNARKALDDATKDRPPGASVHLNRDPLSGEYAYVIDTPNYQGTLVFDKQGKLEYLDRERYEELVEWLDYAGPSTEGFDVDEIIANVPAKRLVYQVFKILEVTSDKVRQYETGDYFCGCPASQERYYPGGDCKHQFAIRLGLREPYY